VPASPDQLVVPAGPVATPGEVGLRDELSLPVVTLREELLEVREELPSARCAVRRQELQARGDSPGRTPVQQGDLVEVQAVHDPTNQLLLLRGFPGIAASKWLDLGISL
jgi:hypothetical protein